jgi:hypothetical protein
MTEVLSTAGEVYGGQDSENGIARPQSHRKAKLTAPWTFAQGRVVLRLILPIIGNPCWSCYKLEE